MSTKEILWYLAVQFTRFRAPLHKCISSLLFSSRISELAYSRAVCSFSTFSNSIFLGKDNQAFFDIRHLAQKEVNYSNQYPFDLPWTKQSYQCSNTELIYSCKCCHWKMEGGCSSWRSLLVNSSVCITRVFLYYQAVLTFSRSCMYMKIMIPCMYMEIMIPCL